MNGYNNKGQRHGYWEYIWLTNNSIHCSKGYYINGNEVGYWEWYNIDDNLEDKEFYL